MSILAKSTVFISLATLIGLDINAFAQGKLVRISMATTFFHDQPKVFVDIAANEFKGVMKNTTGLDGEVSVKFTPAEIAQKIDAKELDFGILYAHEFAWVQKKYPDLQPLLVAATKNPDKRVHLIVHKDSPAKTFADLRGKKFDQPLTTKEYCRIFVNKLCADKDQGGRAKYFGSIAKSASQLSALDAVARSDADATVIDTIWLDFYKETKGPVFAKNLRVLQQSEVVPPAVVVFRKGALEKAIVDKVQAGLRKAHKDARGQALMLLWHIDAFEAVPKDYSKSLANVLKEYPAPDSPR